MKKKMLVKTVNKYMTIYKNNRLMNSKMQFTDQI